MRVEEEEEILSHVISLDTRHPASLKQPLSQCQSWETLRTRAHGAPSKNTQIENKGNLKTNISATWRNDRRAAAENGNNRDEDK